MYVILMTSSYLLQAFKLQFTIILDVCALKIYRDYNICNYLDFDDNTTTTPIKLVLVDFH